MSYPSIIVWLMTKLFRAAVEEVVKSPLEEDFGSYSEEDIQVPQSKFSKIIAFRDVAEPIGKLGELLPGFDLEDMKRIGLRMHEMRPGRSGNFQFQVETDEGTVELQVLMERIGEESSRLTFRSSEQVIALVREAFA